MKLILKLKETTSTMDIAHNLAQKGYPHGTTIVADIQTKGRGRLGRKWLSPLGGLWFSIILRPNQIITENLGFLGIIISTSVCCALEKYLKTKLYFKWPNDIEMEGKKVAGILLEGIYEKDLKYIICGIGINLIIDLKDLIHSNLNASSLKEKLLLKNKDLILIEILQNITRNLEEFPKNWSDIFAYYKNKFQYIGKFMFKKNSKEKIKIIDLMEDGSIFVEEQGEIRKYNWGGISLEIEGISH